MGFLPRGARFPYLHAAAAIWVSDAILGFTCRLGRWGVHRAVFGWYKQWLRARTHNNNKYPVNFWNGQILLKMHKQQKTKTTKHRNKNKYNTPFVFLFVVPTRRPHGVMACVFPCASWQNKCIIPCNEVSRRPTSPPRVYDGPVAYTHVVAYIGLYERMVSGIVVLFPPIRPYTCRRRSRSIPFDRWSTSFMFMWFAQCMCRLFGYSRFSWIYCLFEGFLFAWFFLRDFVCRFRLVTMCPPHRVQSITWSDVWLGHGMRAFTIKVSAVWPLILSKHMSVFPCDTDAFVRGHRVRWFCGSTAGLYPTQHDKRDLYGLRGLFVECNAASRRPRPQRVRRGHCGGPIRVGRVWSRV